MTRGAILLLPNLSRYKTTRTAPLRYLLTDTARKLSLSDRPTVGSLSQAFSAAYGLSLLPLGNISLLSSTEIGQLPTKSNLPHNLKCVL